MSSNVEVLNKGINILVSNIGSLETERFIAFIQQEKFDYTKWQREYFDSIDEEMFLKEAAEFDRKHPFDGTSAVRV